VFVGFGDGQARQDLLTGRIDERRELIPCTFCALLSLMFVISWEVGCCTTTAQTASPLKSSNGSICFIAPENHSEKLSVNTRVEKEHS
jgi:hypothetical protein